MAASREYLALLDGQRELSHIETTDWNTLDLAWNELAELPNETTLLALADIAFDLIVVEGGFAGARKAVIDRARQMHIDKNAGYVGFDNPDSWANFRLSTTFGIEPFDGVLVRMTDKYIRLTNLRRDPTNDRVGESILDTLMDLAAYALIAVCLLREERSAAA